MRSLFKSAALVGAAVLMSLFMSACSDNNPTVSTAPNSVSPNTSPTVVSTTAPVAPTGAVPVPTDLTTPTPKPTAPVTIESLKDFYSPGLDNKRTIDVFLPPGYASATGSRYKVLYANDGQDMTSVELKKTLENLYTSAQIEQVIVVAMYATGSRMSEYGTAGGPDANGRGAKADLYSQFVLNEVMPMINQKYRTQTGPQNTAIIGWSLGGLSAFDLAWRHSDVFGKVGVFSGSFWWRSDDSTVAAKQSSRIMHRIVRESTVKPALKMWFEAGTKDETDDRDGNGVIDAIQDTTELMDELNAKGYQKPLDMVYVEVPNGTHTTFTWGQVLPTFLSWAFGTKH